VSPAAVDGTVVFGSNNDNLYAVGARTGQPKWQIESGDFSWASPVIANQTVVLASKEGRLLAFDVATGGKRWEYPVGSVEFDHTDILVLIDIIVVGSDSALHAIWGT
jgi:outer membrane protein assembly factor BamB